MKPWNSSRWCPPGHKSRADFNEAVEAERKLQALATVQHRELAEDESHSHPSTPPHNEKSPAVQPPA